MNVTDNTVDPGEKTYRTNMWLENKITTIEKAYQPDFCWHQIPGEDTPVNMEENRHEPAVLDKPKVPYRTQLTGVKDYNAAAAMIGKTIDACLENTQIPGDVEAVMELLKEFKPRNLREGILVSQAVASHFMALKQIERARKALVPESASLYLREAHKLQRMLLEILDHLDKDQGKKNQQNIRVEHVHIHDGGQAVVGNVAH